MVNPYKYTFYKIFKFGTRVFNWPDPAYFSVLCFVILIGYNILTILRVLALNGNQIHLPFSESAFAFLLVIVLIIPNYFYFVWKDRYKFFILKFQSEGQLQKVLGSILVFLYFIATFLLFIIVCSIPLPSK
jgi:hypothetical protein